MPQPCQSPMQDVETKLKESAQISMGTEISQEDLASINDLATQVRGGIKRLGLGGGGGDKRKLGSLESFAELSEVVMWHGKRRYAGQAVSTRQASAICDRGSTGWRGGFDNAMPRMASNHAA